MKYEVLSGNVFTIICAGIALRSIVSLHLYSGFEKPPIHGDYEAQRHWQEITINLPPKEWYKDSLKNDLMYWGLDYPPLTAYHSLALGVIGKSVNSSFTELQTSRGFESSEHKSFMRLTVLFSDVFIYIPGLLLLALSLEKVFKINFFLPSLALFLVYPGQILIDNGHFQYNNMSLGLAAIAISMILRNHNYLAAFFFTLALNYKQMELYHAVPFFVYLLRICFLQKSYVAGIRKLALISIVVLTTFLLLWVPWINSIDSILSVIKRLFPFGRGVFEDKVANFWCAVDVILKLKKRFTNQQMAFICLGTTLITVIPANIKLFNAVKKDKFLFSLASTAVSFFLFSFQVHEKSILLVSLPAMCLFGFMPLEMYWFLEVTVFSMFPLLVKDGLILPFFAMFIIFHIIFKKIYFNNYLIYKSHNRLVSKLSSISAVLMLILALLTYINLVPIKYPYLWPLIVSVYSCVHFLIFYIIVNLK